MRAISLFSGAGGFEIGFDRAGIETVLQCEIDSIAQSVLHRHWPDTERISDVRDVGANTPAQLLEQLRRGGGSEAVDLVYGGFPCQDLSVAGKRAGLGGERSGLWFEFHRVLRELRPRWAVIENVVGLLSSNQGRDFGVVLEGLEELGFGGIAWAVLDAQNFGVPQRRRRVFIVAGPSRRACEQVLSLCESCGGNPETGGTAREDVAYALNASVRGTGDGHGNAWNSNYIANPLAGHHHRQDLDNETYVASAISASAGHHGHSSPRGDGPDNLWVQETAYALNAREYKGVSQREGTTNYVVGTLGADGWGGADGQSANSGQLQTTSAGVRRLTPLECERLMGWPDDWTKYDDTGRELADSHRYRLCGNGVVAPVAEWLGRRLMEVDRNDNLR